MKSLLFLSLIISSSVFASELAGRWRNTTDGSVINFLALDGTVRAYSSQIFTSPYGAFAHTIDQSVIFPHIANPASSVT